MNQAAFCRIAHLFYAMMALAVSLVAQPLLEATNNSDGIAFFERNIRPVLAERCYGCHSSAQAQPMGGLVLDTRGGTLRGGKSGAPAIVPGKPDESILIAAVRGSNKDLKMPPGNKPLAARDVENLVAWVKMGAPDPREGAAPLPAPRVSSYDWNKARLHWAFQPVRTAEPPKVRVPEWNKSAIDRFIKSKLDEKGLTPLPRANKVSLIRRATFDLTGLPPTPPEVTSFLADAAPDAFAKVVDRLLASRQYGERWGNHWLDVVRYADTSGNSADFPVPAMYRYRNWVIDAFNADQPYDQFLREQIAGDILAAQDRALGIQDGWQKKITATGYLANARRFAAVMADFHLTIDDTIDSIGKGLMGLTIGCARCHDHKFDPIPTRDYYSLYGIFQSSEYAHPGTEANPHTSGFVSIGTEKQAKTLAEFQEELAAIDTLLDSIRIALISNKTIDKEKVQAEAQARLSKIKARESEYYDAKAHAAYVVTEGKPQNARIFIKGDPEMPGPEQPRGFLTILGGQKIAAHDKGSGRLQLAQWITDPQNPLTARVMVNRIWSWHFGQGLVATPDDFGIRGDPPSHPELLDYLAAEFIDGGWSVKKMHRLMMLSRTYQTAAGHDPKNASNDSKNTYLSAFRPRRLDAEELRDAMLAVSGNLDATVSGAHPFPPELDWKFSQHVPFIATYDNNNRSVYKMRQRIRREPFFDAFDGADTGAVTGVRPVTTTALQALFTMNNSFIAEQADGLSIRVGMAYSSDWDRLSYAYKLAYGRMPTSLEFGEAMRFIRATRRELGKTGAPEDRRNRGAWAALMQVLLMSNEFVILD
ncbi:MAG TPA: PSD1 and planctomycete cytochrome C domain-containing protein [Bryobacteraceae bacterium]|nr:PSD1 and planctomycete cytochrome C domain-containing protein [Bryobacteraceae bacterium]